MEKEGKKSQDNRNSSHAILTTKAVNPWVRSRPARRRVVLGWLVRQRPQSTEGVRDGWRRADQPDHHRPANRQTKSRDIMMARALMPTK
jgi:hypothetical protein